MIRSIDSVVVSAVIAHVLAWAAGAYLAFAPLYTEESSDGVTTTSTLLEVNGSLGAFLLLAPVVLTGVVVRHVWRKDPGLLLPWISAALLWLLCFLGIFSIGLYYIPAALAIVLTAVVYSGRQARQR